MHVNNLIANNSNGSQKNNTNVKTKLICLFIDFSILDKQTQFQF